LKLEHGSYLHIYSTYCTKLYSSMLCNHGSTTWSSWHSFLFISHG